MMEEMEFLLLALTLTLPPTVSSDSTVLAVVVAADVVGVPDVDAVVVVVVSGPEAFLILAKNASSDPSVAVAAVVVVVVVVVPDVDAVVVVVVSGTDTFEV